MHPLLRDENGKLIRSEAEEMEKNRKRDMAMNYSCLKCLLYCSAFGGLLAGIAFVMVSLVRFCPLGGLFYFKVGFFSTLAAPWIYTYTLSPSGWKSHKARLNAWFGTRPEQPCRTDRLQDDGEIPLRPQTSEGFIPAESICGHKDVSTTTDPLGTNGPPPSIPANSHPCAVSKETQTEMENCEMAMKPPRRVRPYMDVFPEVSQSSMGEVCKAPAPWNPQRWDLRPECRLDERCVQIQV